MKNLIFPLVVMMLFNVLPGFAQKPAQEKVRKCFHDRFHDYDNNPVDMSVVYHEFENQLLQSGKLKDSSKESYAELMANLLNDDVRIPIMDWDNANQDIAPLALSSNLATSMVCYEEAFSTSASLPASMENMKPYLRKITEDFNIGRKSVNMDLIRAISDEDFSDVIYRAPVLSLIHAIATYKEEMYQLSLN